MWCDSNGKYFEFRQLLKLPIFNLCNAVTGNGCGDVGDFEPQINSFCFWDEGFQIDESTAYRPPQNQ